MDSNGIINENKIKKEIEQIYNYYFFNLHQLVNQLNYKFEWIRASKYRFSNFGEYDVSDFSRLPNPYLLDYQHDKIKLAEDILANGMFFPFYGGKLDNPINPDLYFIIQGKHRLYSLKRYSENVQYLEDEFLFITYPIDVQYFRMANHEMDKIKNPIYMYDYNEIEQKLELVKVDNYTTSLKIMDRFGTYLGNYLYKLRKQGINIKGHQIINNKQAFEDFIWSPFNLEIKEEI